ncbi:MAG: S8 family serine peptidase [Patescibacteria group bacterium]
MKIIKYLLKIRKSLLTLFLTSNLLLVSTGSADLNLATPSAVTEIQSTESSQLNDVINITEAITPSPEIAPIKQSRKIDPTGRFAENRIIVKFKDNIDNQKKTKLMADNSVSLEREMLAPNTKLLRVSSDKREKILEKLKSDPNIEYAGHDYVGSATGAFGGGGGSVPSPNDPYYNRQWSLNRILAPTVWNTHKGSATVKVAVLDSGVNYNLPEFGVVQNGGRIIKGKDFVNDDMDPMDDNGHGTAVASVLGAVTNNGVDIAAVDWNAQIIAVKTNDSSANVFSADMADGIRWAVDYTSLLKVINISSNFLGDDPILHDAVNYALGKGVLVVAGTANSPAGQVFCFGGYPASYQGVLAVVGTDSGDRHGTGCTQFVQGSLMSAPGVDIYTENALGGVNIPPAIFTLGTSFASPLVAGAASVLFSCSTNPRPSLSQVRIALMLGDDLGAVGWDPYFGYGRLNLFKASQNVSQCN